MVNILGKHRIHWDIISIIQQPRLESSLWQLNWWRMRITTDIIICISSAYFNDYINVLLLLASCSGLRTNTNFKRQWQKTNLIVFKDNHEDIVYYYSVTKISYLAVKSYDNGWISFLPQFRANFSFPLPDTRFLQLPDPTGVDLRFCLAFRTFGQLHQGYLSKIIAVMMQ